MANPLLLMFFLCCSCWVQNTLSEVKNDWFMIEVEGDEAASKEEFGSDYGGVNPNPYGNSGGGHGGGGHFESAPFHAPVPAPVHCSWGQYGGWSGGNQACGPGTKTRSRSCTCSDGSSGSGRCGGGSATQTQQANKQACGGGGHESSWNHGGHGNSHSNGHHGSGNPAGYGKKK